MKTLLTLSILLIPFLGANAQLQEALDTWMPNNEVNRMTRGDGKIFLSGDFDWYGEPLGLGFAVLNTQLGEYDSDYPDKDYYARNAISDGAGGWYISDYSTVSHIRQDKTVESLPFVFEGGGYPINALEKVGNILYVGGNFTNINTTILQKYVAAIDLTTNTLTSWNPNPSGYVYALKAAGSVVYVGGGFTSIGGQTRSRIAAIDATTGLATLWNANVATSFGYVFTIDVGPGTVYFGGSFTNVGGGSPSRRNFAAVNNTTGALTSFNPRPDDNVTKILLDGNTLYISGDYTQIAGVSRSVLAALDVTTGSLTAFSTTIMSPYTSDHVYAMAIDGQKLFIGGLFLTVNGVERARLAVLNKTTGALEPMDEDRAISDFVICLAVSDGKLLVGGSFRGITGVTTSLHCVAIDENTGELADWRLQIPPVSGDEYISDLGLHYQGDRVYYIEKIYFSSDGYYGTMIGAVNTTDGAVVGWTAEVDGEVTSWAFSNTTLYIAGEFTEVNGSARNRFAAIDLVTGNLTSFNPVQFDGLTFNSLAVRNDILYATGEFSFTEGSTTYTNIASWNTTTGAINTWAPQNLSDHTYMRIGPITNDHVYIMGSAFRIDVTTGEADSGWNPDVGYVNSMVVQGSSVYIAGGFSPGLVHVNIETGELSGWQPSFYDVEDVEGEISALIISGNKLFVGGGFYFDVGGADRGYFAIYALPAPTNNQPPQILATTTAVPIEGIVTVDLEPLISDPDDNLDPGSLYLANNVSEQGASASLEDGSFILTLNYGGIQFFGTDRVTLGVCDLAGECTEQELTIDVGGDVIVFNALSPNGDGKNEIFTLQYIDILPETQSNKVTILNRWGDVVFDVADYNNTDRVFKGIGNNGKELPSGTYYYKIEFSGKTKTGYLSLKR